MASACAFCATLAADLMASAALWLASTSALEKLAPIELVMLAMLWDSARLALCDAELTACEIACVALALAWSACREASADAWDMDRDADSAALCCSRALASDCCVWLSCCVACCSDWLSCWLDWLTCRLAWLTDWDCWLRSCSWLLSAWICP